MNFLQEIIDKDADPRVKNWYFMSNPLPTIIISIIYAIVVKKIGPQLMKNRKPFDLKNIIICYNAAQVGLSTYIFYTMAKYGLFRFNNILCEPVNMEDTDLLNAVWWYYFAKFTEFFDTIFFLLRKKYNQISTLHVFHHGIMPTITWIGLKYTPGGTGSIFGVINSFVHIVMYSYYMFAAMGPKYQKYLWWKRYLTIFQLVQFVTIISHSIILILSDCKINKIFSYSILTVVFIFFVLFSDFYKKTYTEKEAKKDFKTFNDNPKPGTSFMSPRGQYENRFNLKPKRS